MIPLLKIYDDFTSNKYVSLGISVASTAFSAYGNISMIRYYQYTQPLAVIISACAGIAFALLTNTYLVQNERVKNESEKNSVRATFSLFSFGISLVKVSEDFRGYIENIEDLLPNCIRSIFNDSSCFRLSFLVTNLALQILEGKTKFKFQSPIVFA